MLSCSQFSNAPIRNAQNFAVASLSSMRHTMSLSIFDRVSVDSSKGCWNGSVKDAFLMTPKTNTFENALVLRGPEFWRQPDQQSNQRYLVSNDSICFASLRGQVLQWSAVGSSLRHGQSTVPKPLLITVHQQEPGVQRLLQGWSYRSPFFQWTLALNFGW